MEKLVKKILLGLNLMLALALLLSYLSVLINPEKIALPAFFGLAYPYLLFANIIFVIIWGVNFKKELFISLLVIVLGINHLNNYIRFAKEKRGEYDFNILSYNIRLFNHYDNEKNSENDIVSFLKSENPDIVCLQEVYINGPVTDIKNKFANQLNPDYNVHYKFFRISGRRNYGIVTFSRYPVIGRGDILHPSSASLSIYTDVIIKNDTFRIYNNHLQSFKLRRMEKSLLEEIYDSEESDAMRELRNLSFSLKQGFARRASQAQTVKEHIMQSPYPVVVCGDFNDTPVSYSYRRIRKGLKDAFVESGSGAGFTYKGKYPPNRIDFILFDDRLISTGYRSERIRYSDHYPVMAYFRIRN